MPEHIEVLIEAPPHRLVKHTDPLDGWIGVETLQPDGQWLSMGHGYKQLIQSMINNLDQLRRENARLRARIRELEQPDMAAVLAYEAGLAEGRASKSRLRGKGSTR